MLLVTLTRRDLPLAVMLRLGPLLFLVIEILQQQMLL
jgi:hypothetical protein